MPDMKNMKRLQRGEMSRISQRAGKHTDVHIGAPPVPTASVASLPDDRAEKLQAQIQKLQETNSKLENEVREAAHRVDNQLKDDNNTLAKELKRVLAQAEELASANKNLEEKLEEVQAQQQEALEPVKGLRVVRINEITETDDLMRLDCELKPTTGPLANEGAIIIPIEEINKLLERDSDGE